jgi:CO dehydrogenase/acetyl-CoA synthase alpha subunit
MTDEELRTLVASLAVSTANSAAEARSNTEAIRELRETLRESTEGQTRSIEALREGMSYNTEIMANALELSALSQRTAAEALQLSANTSRNLDRLENDIADLKQIVGIVIRDNQADRTRITRLEDQE